jgi:hypothetical protein
MKRTDKMLVPNNIVYGNYHEDWYFIVKEDEGLLVVNSNFFGYENAILFTIGHGNSDWSENMLLENAKKVVDFLNSEEKRGKDKNGK